MLTSVEGLQFLEFLTPAIARLRGGRTGSFWSVAEASTGAPCDPPGPWPAGSSRFPLHLLLPQVYHGLGENRHILGVLD